MSAEFPVDLNSPKVSICVQTYNHAAHIGQCLDGMLMQQTGFPFEIILGEDESNDGTREICQEYSSRFPNKINLYLRSRKDVIKINGRSTGRYNFIQNFKACKGEYIALCEGDDYWTDKEKLQSQVDFLDNNPEYVLSFHYTQIHKDGVLENDYLNEGLKEKMSLEDLIVSNRFRTLSCVFRRKALLEAGFPKWFNKSAIGDYVLYILLAQKGKINVLPKIMGAYRIHDGGIWEKRPSSYRNIDFIYTQHLISKDLDLINEQKIKKEIIRKLDSMDGKNAELMEYMGKFPVLLAYKSYCMKIRDEYENSITFRLGNTLLKPFKLIKRVIRG